MEAAAVEIAAAVAVAAPTQLKCKRCARQKKKKRSSRKGLVRIFTQTSFHEARRAEGAVVPAVEEEAAASGGEGPDELLLLQLKAVLRSLEEHMAGASRAQWPVLVASGRTSSSPTPKPSSTLTSTSSCTSVCAANKLSSVRKVTLVNREREQERAPAAGQGLAKARAKGSPDESENALAKHKQRYTCPLCQRSFLWLGHLKRHLRTHEGKALFTCRECLFTTTRRSALAKHALSHMHQPPFRCPECAGEFATKKALLRHIDAAHREPRRKKRSAPGSQALYRCPECAYASRKRREFVKHLLGHMEKRRLGRSGCAVKLPERKEDAHPGSRPHRPFASLIKTPSSHKLQ